MNSVLTYGYPKGFSAIVCGRVGKNAYHNPNFWNDIIKEKFLKTGRQKNKFVIEYKNNIKAMKRRVNS